jgi:hypothetical protein
MRAISLFARSVAAGTSLLLLQTLESVYARCRSQTLRAIDHGADPLVSPGSGRP